MYRINCIAIAFALTLGRAAAEIPPIGTDTGDGYKVAALWTFHYHSQARNEERAIGGPMRSLDAPLNYEKEIKGEANVTEEVNKSTGQIRAVIRNGKWSTKVLWLHYTDKYGTHINAGDDAEEKGELKHAAIGYGYDEKLKKPTVHFAITSNEGVEARKFKVPYHPLDEKGFDVTVSSKMDTADFISGVSGGCDVPFTASYLYKRKRTPEDGSSIPYTEIVIERTPREIEAEIKPADDYKNWVPSLDGAAAFEARIVNPPGLRADQWQFSLTDVSTLAGVCNNANIDDFPALAAQWQNSIGKNSPDLLFDFRRYGKTDKNFQAISKPWKELCTARPTAGVSVAVSCLDWGAHGRISAKAIVDGQPVEAICRETKENFIRIPWASNDGDDNKMAAAAKTWRGDKKYYRRDPNSDDDEAPTGKAACKGDGLIVFDEYRGFYVRSGGVDAAAQFIRLDPDHKDLFIYMFRTTAQLLGRHVPDFEKASALDVHRVGDDHLLRFVDFDSRVIDFNSEHPKQHGLYLAVGDLVNGHGGESILGPPVSVQSVTIDWKQSTKCDSYSPNYAKATVVHELGHAVGIDHHGKAQYQTSKGETVAQEGGEYSGDTNCAMKYVGASFYVHRSAGPVTLATLLSGPTLYPYDPKHIEKNGLIFCRSAHGTGLNDKGDPDWQCGDADLGNCAAQIVVNDQCAGGPGGKSGRNLPDNPRQRSLPHDASERTASDAQERAHVSFELTAGSGREKEIVPGEAAIFEVILSGLPSDSAALEVGSSAKAWTEQIEFFVADKDGKFIPAPLKIRPAGKARRVVLAGATPEIHEESSPRLRLSPNEQISASFALDAEASATMQPGTMRLFSGITPVGKTERVISNSVELVIRKPDTLAPDEQTHLDARRIFSQAQLAFAEGHFAEAEGLARKILPLMPDSAEEIHLLLARALEEQNKLKEAYDEYQASLASHRPTPGVIDEPPYVTIFTLRALEKKLGIERKPVVATVDMFFSHELYAETAGGKAKQPFPKTMTRLGFNWKSALPIGADLLGVRWVAEDVSGVEKNHVVASSKSESDKREGEFSLTKPTAGFPPGQYRVEIWQGGKMIYSEKFEVKPD
jgi:hypothetical protein